MSDATTRHFKPKVGGFYVALVAVPVLAIVAALGLDWRARYGGLTAPMSPALAIVVLVALVAVLGLVLGTRYSFRDHELFVRFAVFFRVVIPYANITSVCIVNSIQASAALDRRRIRITRGDASVAWKRVCDVSPADEKYFLALLKDRVSPSAWALPAAALNT